MEEPIERNQICACILSFGQVPRLEECMDSVGKLPILLFNPVKSWWNDDMEDQTLSKVASRKINIVRHDWKDETEVRNAMQEMSHRLGYRLMIMLDADEVLDDLDSCIEEIKANPFYGAYTCELTDYGPNNEKLPSRDHQPVIAVDTRMIKSFFVDKRCVSATLKRLSCRIKHYSYDVPEEWHFKLNKKDGDDWPPPEHRGVIE